MIKLICPRCMKPVPVADDFSGKEVTCPNCMKPFDAPARYNPAVLSEPPPAPPPRPVGESPAPRQESPAARPEPPPIPPRLPEPTMSPETPQPPPGVVPTNPLPPVLVPAPAPQAPPPGFVVPPPVPATPAVVVPTPQVPGYAHARGITFAPRVVAWLPAILLTITFACTFFRWIGSYYGGYPVYSQSPWRAMFGSVSRNFDLEAYMPGGGAWIDQVNADWGLMLPYLLLLILAGGLAWADRAFLLNPQHASIVRLGMGGFWAWRRTVIAGLATLALLLVLVQLARGFGMERAIRAAVREDPKIVEARTKAAGSPALLAKAENQERAMVDREYMLERTWWQDAALACNVLAVLAVCGSILLEKRGSKPPPKLLLHY